MWDRDSSKSAYPFGDPVPKLQKLRHDLVPKYLIEDVFWQVYFLLITSKTKDLDWECDEELSDEEGEDEEHQSEQSEVSC